MSDKDVDAQFADIIAHWNDVTDEPDRGPRPPDPACHTCRPGRRGSDRPALHRRLPHRRLPDRRLPGRRLPGRRQQPHGDTAHPARPLAGAPVASAGAPATAPQRFRFEGGTERRPGAEPVEPPPSWRSPEPVDEPEEHFQPGPTAPLPAGDLQFWGILAGLVGGPLMLVYLVLFNREGNPLWMLAAVGITVAGFGLLVQRLPRHRDDDDDGAVL